MPVTVPPSLDVKLIRGADDDDAIVDMRYFPLSIIKFRGNPSEKLVHQYYEWRKKASAFAATQGTVHMVIKDIDEWGVPKPTIRKLISEYSALDKDETGFAWRYLAVTKAVMRGAVTAIVWMRGDQGMYSFVSSIREGIERALQLYNSKNLTPPSVDPSSYTLPDR